MTPQRTTPWTDATGTDPFAGQHEAAQGVPAPAGGSAPTPREVEETRRLIRNVAIEIARRAKSDMAPQEFHAEFLPRVVDALGAVAGVVWTVDGEGRLAVSHQVNLSATGIRGDEQRWAQHARLLLDVFQAGEEKLLPAADATGDGGADSRNPTSYSLLFGPLKTELEVVGLVEIFQRPEAGPATLDGNLAFLSQLSERASEFHKSRQLRQFGDRQALWTQLEDFVQAIHESLDPRDTAYTLVNEGRRLIDCDRVTVVSAVGGKCRIEAISGQDVFERRSNMVRLLERLAAVAVRSREPIWYTGDASGLAPQVERAVNAYVAESLCKAVVVVPLIRPREESEEEEPDRRRAPEPPIGALIVERIDDGRISDEMRRRIEYVVRHGQSAVANAREHGELFLMPLWRMLGKSRVLISAQQLPKTLLVAAVLLALVLVPILVPWRFTLHCGGTLEPVVRSDVFAGSDGRIDNLYVQHGTVVVGPEDAGPDGPSVLATMRNTDLQVAMQGVRGELDGYYRQREQLRALRGGRGVSQTQRDEWDYEIVKISHKILSLEKELALYEVKSRELIVTAPISGVVTDWELEDRLAGRPVLKGQVLMQIAQVDGSWQLELAMPERRMGHLVAMRRQLKEKDPDAELRVEFVMATDPDETFHGTVRQIDRRAEVRGDEGSTVLVKVDLDDQASLPKPLRPGSTVSAKIDCGHRPLYYVLLNDALAFVRQKVLFRIF